MKRIKKLSALMLVAMLSVSLLSACGGSSGSDVRASGNPDGPVTAVRGGEPITLQVYSQTANFNGEMTGWFAQILLEKFNVKFNVINDEDGVYETRMESGDLGDLVTWGTDGKKYIDALTQGFLFDWEEDDILAEYGPYILENMPAALEKNRQISERETGKPTLHGFGHNVAANSTDHEDFTYTWDLRWDLYAKLGYPEIKDLKDFADVLEQMRDINPTDDIGNPVYALSIWPDWDGTMIMYVKSTATAYYGFDEFEMGLYDFDTGDFYPTLLPGGPYIEMLKFYNDLHRRGLLDPDSETQTWDPMIAKVQNGGTLFSIFNFSGSENYNSERHLEENKIMLPVAPENARQYVHGLNVYGGSRIWSIGAKSQYPELVMEIINWLCTPEGRLTVDYGPKGLTWDYDEEGNTYFTDLGKLTDADRNTEMEAPYSGQFGDGSFQVNNTTWINMSMNPDSNGDLYNKKFWKRNPPEPRNDAEIDWREKTGAVSYFDYLYSRPKLVSVGTTFSSLARSVEVESAWQQVILVIKNGSWEAIRANSDLEFEDAVAAMIDEANRKGYDMCIEFSISEAERMTELVNAVRAMEGN